MDYLSIALEMLEAKNASFNTIRTYKTYLKPYLNYLDSLNLLPEEVSWEIVRDLCAPPHLG